MLGQNHSNGGYRDIITTPNIPTPQMNKVTDISTLIKHNSAKLSDQSVLVLLQNTSEVDCLYPALIFIHISPFSPKP